MLKRKLYYTYKGLFIPKSLVLEGCGYSRFKTKKELKRDFDYFFKKLFAKFKKRNIYKSNWSITKSLSSFDYHIQEKGGIVDNMGNIHTTAKSYKNYLKENDLVIKDWTDGSIKPKQQLADRADIAKIVNKYL